MSSPLSQYLQERFPVPAYVLLIGAMVIGTGAAAAQGLHRSVPLTWQVAVVTLVLLLGFFLLRVFDEHKDFDRDLVAHPDRVLSRGVITLADLRRLGAIAFLIQVGLSTLLGPLAILWCIIYVLFAVAMRYEFGVSAWLNRHLVIYAVTHNPIVALMMLYAVVALFGGLTWSTPIVAWLLVATTTSLGFEVARKVRAPQDEKPAQDTYSQALGVPGAVALLWIIAALATASLAWLLTAAWAMALAALIMLQAAAAAAAFRKRPTASRAKWVENAYTLGALAAYLLVFADVAIRQGIAWT